MSFEVGVLGAGAIGCFVGGALAAAGARVTFVGRERIKAELESNGFALTDLEGGTRSVSPDRVRVATDAEALADSSVVLCCVKSAQTPEAAERLAGVLRADSIVVSLQNGVGNADVLRKKLGARTVLGGIVGFNVVSKGGGAFHRGTSGPIVIEASSDPRVRQLASALSSAGFEVDLARDIRARQWSKLIMNLNNAVSALTDAPTVDLIFVREYRRCLAAIIEEALDVMRIAGIRTKRIGAIPATWFPRILALPTPILRVIARAQIKVDPEARSSMWEDLAKRRATEVDFLNGEIVRLAESAGTSAPRNRRIVELVHEAERKGEGSPKLSADALWRELAAVSSDTGPPI